MGASLATGDRGAGIMVLHKLVNLRVLVFVEGRMVLCIGIEPASVQPYRLYPLHMPVNNR